MRTPGGGERQGGAFSFPIHAFTEEASQLPSASAYSSICQRAAGSLVPAPQLPPQPCSLGPVQKFSLCLTKGRRIKLNTWLRSLVTMVSVNRPCSGNREGPHGATTCMAWIITTSFLLHWHEFASRLLFCLNVEGVTILYSRPFLSSSLAEMRCKIIPTVYVFSPSPPPPYSLTV